MSKSQIVASIKSLIDIATFFEDWESVRFYKSQLEITLQEM